MFILKKRHQPGVYVPLRALFLVSFIVHCLMLMHELNSLFLKYSALTSASLTTDVILGHSCYIQLVTKLREVLYNQSVTGTFLLHPTGDKVKRGPIQPISHRDILVTSN